MQCAESGSDGTEKWPEFREAEVAISLGYCPGFSCILNIGDINASADENLEIENRVVIPAVTTFQRFRLIESASR